MFLLYNATHGINIIIIEQKIIIDALDTFTFMHFSVIMSNRADISHLKHLKTVNCLLTDIRFLHVMS